MKRAALLWAALSAVLVAAGVVVLLACGGPFAFLNFCTSDRAQLATTLRAEHADLIRERDRRLASINRAPLCRLPELASADPDLAPPSCQARASDALLVLVDVSGSMEWDYAADPAIEERLDALYAQMANPFNALFGNNRGEIARLERQLNRPDRINRIDVAKRALSGLVDGLPDTAALRLLDFAQCDRRVQDRGTFRRGDADAYRRAVERLSLRSNTALARAIDELPSMTEAGRTPDRPATIVILSDGRDSCRGDPCAAARRMRAAMPHADVSVVSLSNSASANACIAEATEGRFLEADDLDQLMLQVRRSAGQLRADECVGLETGRTAPPQEEGQ